MDAAHHGLAPGGVLNVALSDQWRLLDLAELDARAARLVHRRAVLPEVARLVELTTRQGQVATLLVGAQTEESDVAREQTRAEADVDAVRTRAVRDQQRLDSGAVSSPKELESLQHEILSLARRQGDLEDTVLEIMERRESAAGRAQELAGERDALIVEIKQVSDDRDRALAEIATELGAVAQERGVLAGGLSTEFVALYEKIRASVGGVGAAALRRGRCEGCRMELSTTELTTLREAAENLVARCEECRRILVRVADSGL